MSSLLADTPGQLEPSIAQSDLKGEAANCVGGVKTPVLADDGANLAAAVQTIIEQGSGDLERTVADAFEGSEIAVVGEGGVFDLRLRQPGMLRPLRTAELSDGTLRYLLWAAALLTVDPPTLMVLNEPETSLHPQLLPALARLIRRAAERTQTLVVSHAHSLIDGLGVRPIGEEDHDLADRRLEIELVKDLGETRVVDQGLLTTPPWNWGTR